MIQIRYLSRATEPMSADDLLALLEQCSRNNTKNGITGMLIYGNETFLQALEGDEDLVDALIEKIGRDPRHKDMQILERKPVEARRYADWSMGFARISGEEIQSIEGLEHFDQKDFTSDYLAQHGEVVDALMDHYRGPFWNPLVRELDAQDKAVEKLKKTLASTQRNVAVASLMLESVIDASRKGALREEHVRLCQSALDTLRRG